MRPLCVFCQDGAGKAGKLLKCLHKICLDCLPASVQQDGQIRCSKCRRSTPCPPPARNHEQVLVDDSMFDSVPESHDGTKKANEKDKVLEVFADENMNPSSIPQQPTSSLVVRPTEVDAQVFHKQIPHDGRVHFCPYHSTMKLRYYCTRCREVLCETCKAQIKHESHIDQINDATEVAATLRHRLTERLRKIVPDDKEKEVNESLDYAGDLLTAFECDSASQVSRIKTMIEEQCQELLLRVKKRKEKLIDEGSIRKKHLVELQECYELNNGKGAFQHVLDGIRYAVKNEDLVKMHPHSIQLLTEASSDIIAKTSSILQRRTFTCKKPSELQEHFGVMGQVVDNTDINLSCCSFPRPEYVAFAGEPFSVKALVRNSQGQALSEASLKVSSIQIWATRIEGFFSPAVPVLVPISDYSEGWVHAGIQLKLSRPTVFLLELLLDAPCSIPEFQIGSLKKELYMFFPLKTWLYFYKSRASYFHTHFCSPRENIQIVRFQSHLSQAFAGMDITQERYGVATARASQPVQDRGFAVTFLIARCPSSKIDIGFTWECPDTSQEMKLVLASSARSHSSSTPICNLVTGDLIYVTRCPNKQCKYNIDHYCPRSGLLKNNHSVRIDSNTKPILMVRMFDRDTRIQVFEQNKKQQNQFMQDYKSHLFASAKTVGK